MTQRFSNNAQAELASAISAAATSLAVSVGQGALFPALSAGQVFMVTMESSPTSATSREILRVTSVNGDHLKVTRGQEGTDAQAWGAGAVVDHRLTAGALEEVRDGLSNAASVVSAAVSAEATVRAATDDALSTAISVVSNALSVETAARSALSDRVASIASQPGGTASATSAEVATLVQVASAAATSADSHAATASAAATSADVHAATASAAATTVDARVNSVLTFLSGISARSAGVSTHGLQSVVNALSLRIDNAGGGGSVTSAEVQVASAAATSADAHAAAASAAATSIGTLLGTLSDRFTSASAQFVSIDGRVTSVNTFLGGLSVRTSAGGATSIKGLQSVLNALSTQISNEASLRGASVSVLSLAVTSVDARVNTVSNLVSANLSAVTNASTAGSIAALSLASAQIQATSVALAASIANAQSAAINASTAGSIAALSLASIQIQATSVALAASVANAQSAAVNASTAGSIAALSLASIQIQATSAAAIANDASVSAVIVANYGAGQFKIVTGAQAIATATFTKVSGLSLSIAGSGFYEVHGQLVWSMSGAGSASAIFGFGMSMTAQPVMAMFCMQGNAGAMAAASGLQNFVMYGGNSAICATPSIMYSAKPNPGVSGSVANTMFFDGILQASTVQSQLKVVAQCSTGAFGINIAPGSWIRAFKVG